MLIMHHWRRTNKIHINKFFIERLMHFTLIHFFNGLIFKESNISISLNSHLNYIPQSRTKLFMWIIYQNAFLEFAIKLGPLIFGNINKSCKVKHPQMLKRNILFFFKPYQECYHPKKMKEKCWLCQLLCSLSISLKELGNFAWECIHLILWQIFIFIFFTT